MATIINRTDLQTLPLYVERNDVMKLLGVSRLTMWRRERRGLIIPIPMAGRVYYRGESLRNLLVRTSDDTFKIDRIGKAGPKPNRKKRRKLTGRKPGRKSTLKYAIDGSL